MVTNRPGDRDTEADGETGRERGWTESEREEEDNKRKQLRELSKQVVSGWE